LADITPLIISYPDFILGQIIDPEEFDQNNMEVVNKVNETIGVVNTHTVGISDSNTKADNAVTIANSANTKADNAVAIANTANTKADNAVATANSANTKADNAVATANSANTKADNAVATANSANTKAGNAVVIANAASEDVSDAVNALGAHSFGSATHIKSARFVIGTSVSGWTAKDCDYLCDGTEDQIEINAAIQALPDDGGEVVILDGTYNIAAKIDINKNNVSLRGNGNATILKRMWNDDAINGVITLSNVSGCGVVCLQVDGNKTTHISSKNCGIYLYSSNNNNNIASNTCNNNGNSGIYLAYSDNNNIASNVCDNNNGFYGIRLYYSSKNNIASNTCNNNHFSGICLSVGSDNIITGNICNNNNSGIELSHCSASVITSNICNNNIDCGIYTSNSNNNTITGNTCNNNNSGIYLYFSRNNAITSNTCIRLNGASASYSTSQYTIRLIYTDNCYNLISSNNCMGKAVVIEGGTSNTEVNNKWE